MPSGAEYRAQYLHLPVRIEFFVDDPAAGRTYLFAALPPEAEPRPDRSGQGLSVVFREQRAAYAGFDRFVFRPLPVAVGMGDHRGAEGQRMDRGEAHVAGADARRAVVQKGADDVVVVSLAVEPYAVGESQGVDLFFEPLHRRPVADKRQIAGRSFAFEPNHSFQQEV